MVSCALSDILATFAVSYSPQILTDMKRFVLFTMLAGILASCNSTLSVDNTPVAHLDLNRYLGEWYEIARFVRFERGMEHTKASYALNEDSTVRVINSGIKNGKLKEAEGKAKLTDTPALLRVSFFGPFYGDYRVMLLDKDYRYALIGSGSDDYLWILSRTPKLSENDIITILEEARRRKYDIGRLLWVKQE